MPGHAAAPINRAEVGRRPRAPGALMSWAEVMALTGIGRRGLRAAVASGVLPKPVQLSPRCSRFPRGPVLQALSGATNPGGAEAAMANRSQTRSIMESETRTLVAARPIQAFQVVAVDGGAHAYPLAGNCAGGSIGLAQNASDIAAGTMVDVVTAGPAVACAGAPVAAGEQLCANAAGLVQPVPTGYAGLIVGRALDAAAGAGELILVRVQPMRVVPAVDDAESSPSR